MPSALAMSPISGLSNDTKPSQHGSSNGDTTTRSAAGSGRRVTNVLQAAHTVSITHRDLKPDNLFLVPDAELIGGERIKVLDFGIAKLVGDARPSHVETRTDLVMGTLNYMSLEQCCSASAADARSDVYSSAASCSRWHAAAVIRRQSTERRRRGAPARSAAPAEPRNPVGAACTTCAAVVSRESKIFLSLAGRVCLYLLVIATT